MPEEPDVPEAPEEPVPEEPEVPLPDADAAPPEAPAPLVPAAVVLLLLVVLTPADWVPACQPARRIPAEAMAAGSAPRAFTSQTFRDGFGRGGRLRHGLRQ